MDFDAGGQRAGRSQTGEHTSEGHARETRRSWQEEVIQHDELSQGCSAFPANLSQMSHEKHHSHSGSKWFSINAPAKPSAHYVPRLKGNSLVEWGSQSCLDVISIRSHVTDVYSMFNEPTRTPRSSHSCVAWSPQVPSRQWSGTPAWTSCDPPFQADLKR